MQYYALFDEEGNRITTYVEGIHLEIPIETIAVSEEEQILYTTNLYKKGVDGKPELMAVVEPVLTPSEKREEEYMNNKCIEWQDELITVDNANDLFGKYLAEGNAKSIQLQGLISEAKTDIRLRIPNEVE